MFRPIVERGDFSIPFAIKLILIFIALILFLIISLLAMAVLRLLFIKLEKNPCTANMEYGQHMEFLQYRNSQRYDIEHIRFERPLQCSVL